MKEEKVKFIVIGYGHIGCRHVQLILENKNCELLGVVEVENKVPTNIKHWNSLNDCLKSFDSVPSSTIASICLPNGLHALTAKLCIENGMHVLIEKPMCISVEEGEQIIKTAKINQKQVFIVKQNRYSPSVKWMKEMVDSKKIGKILYVGMNCFWNRDERYYYAGGWRGTKDLDGGTLFTQFSHFIDILYWVFGDIKNIQAKLSNLTHTNQIDFEDTGLVNFEFERGGLGSINYTTSVWDKNLESSMVVIGEKGSFKIGGQYMNTIDYCHVANYTKPDFETNVEPNQYGTFSGSAANHHFVIENIVNVLHGNEQIAANAAEGLKVVDIIERIYMSGKRDKY